jgi:type II secretory ATPase GspE/PulE/Tfp pilus assembly ATPase PilB-like protein
MENNTISNEETQNVFTPISNDLSSLNDYDEQNNIDQTNDISKNVQEELNNVNNVIEQPVVSAAVEVANSKEVFSGMVTFDYNNVPITDIVNSIILDAMNKGASDIHFDPFDEGIKIRIRIDGVLRDYSIVPLYVKKNMITRIKIISGMNITESRMPQDGAIRTELANKSIDLRVSCLPTNLGEKIVIRVMDYSMSASGVEALDFNQENLEKVLKMINLPNGIILVTGATGSGKSTTVYSMLQKLNVEGTNLITVEDPIEMNIPGVNQVQAQAEIGLDFATVLRSILRQDPDVIMIGEIRDDETARIAVRASITGHLVLSTIHTNNSLNTIERLTDMSVERYLLGSSLSGIISQKLARRLCPHCKKLRPTTEYEKDIFKRALDKDIGEIYEAVGCNQCSKGYRGRIAIHEVLLVDQELKDAITNNLPKEELREIVYGENGTETMLQDGLEKVIQGITSFDEIIKLIDLEDDLGSGTNLGLDNQLEESNKVNARKQEMDIKDEELVNELIKNANLIGKRGFINKSLRLINKINEKEIILNDFEAKEIKKMIDQIDDYIYKNSDKSTKSYENIIDELNELIETSSNEETFITTSDIVKYDIENIDISDSSLKPDMYEISKIESLDEFMN